MSILEEEVETGVVTIANVATYLEELKAKAGALRQMIAARDRGYFTPAEEESARAAFYSYLQTRAALLDLVLSIHAKTRDSRETQFELFLIGFAGAALLVDAARFTVDAFGGSETIIRKLNEADPTLGVQAGAFDAIHESLTRPAHVWRLYQANQFLEERGELLDNARKSAAIAPVVAVIDRLRGRLLTAPAEYARLRADVRWRTARTGAKRLLMGEIIYGLQEAMSRMVSDLSTAPEHRPKLPAPVRRQLRSLLCPGDVLVTRKEHAMTNYFLPGFWPHAALYIGDSAATAGNPVRQVLEALKDGVQVRPLRSPLSSDAVAVIRPALSPPEISAAIQRGLKHRGKPYDFDFDFTRSDRMVCTEVVYRTYEGVGSMRFRLTPRVGRLTLAAEDLLAMAVRREQFSTVAVYVPKRTTRAVVKEEAERVLRETMANDPLG